jgi:diguanylate cyclase (GGDEF)-like protein
MFRHAVVALYAQRAHRYVGGQHGRERSDGPPAALPDPCAELAEARDRAAAIRDRVAVRRDAELGSRQGGRIREALGAAAEDRRDAAADRKHAAADRARAHNDRVDADHDQLTGAMARGSGVRGIEREIARTRRTGEPLTLAFVDVDRLKRVNDGQGHAAGDALLRDVVTALRSGLRAADLIVRYGGDEFLCALPGAGKRNAAERLEVSEGVLAGFASGSLSVGLAELRAGEDAAALISRADRALYAARGRLLQTP